MTRAFPVMLIVLLAVVSGVTQESALIRSVGTTRELISPVLEFPQPGMDDPSAYRGYATRFFRDTDGNAVQAILNSGIGRVVTVWANGLNESISFSVRDSAGGLASFRWRSDSARRSSEGDRRFLEYTILIESPEVEVGLFLLGSMRKERDFQYQERHRLPLDSMRYVEPELLALLHNLERLPPKERKRHVSLLNATEIRELRNRFDPIIKSTRNGDDWIVSIEQPTFDGTGLLSLQLSGSTSESVIQMGGTSRIPIRAINRSTIPVTVVVGTDAPSLTPLSREEIFNPQFLTFYRRAEQEHDSLLRLDHRSRHDVQRVLLRFQWMEREVKGVELLSYREKLMAGLPNFATYFGRDMMMAALMMEPVWKPSMQEHVIASVLDKLAQSGEVSHEEALGGQAIRENASVYNGLISEYFQRRQSDTQGADSVQRVARSILQNLSRTRENYIMVDDDFQLPVVAARYLTRDDVTRATKRAFLLNPIDERTSVSRLGLLIRNLDYVATITRPYIEHPDVRRIVSFPKRGENGWISASWRDSQAGYAGGRFAMDVNAIWIPAALEAMRRILPTLGQLGISTRFLDSLVPGYRNSTLSLYWEVLDSLDRAIQVWRDVARYFEVSLPASHIREKIEEKLNWFGPDERSYWHTVVRQSGADSIPIRFLALSLDSTGNPIPVVNTDPATWLFLGNFTEEVLRGAIRQEDVHTFIEEILRPYPIGLFVERLGPLAANDAYASREIWDRFRRDQYHSPYVVWGREVNLLLAGLAKQILAAYDTHGRLKDQSLKPYLDRLHAALRKIHEAVEASNLKHNELWTYRVMNGTLEPVRYPTSTDIQLWNLTDLAVQYNLHLLEQVR